MPIVIPNGFVQITWDFSSSVGTGPFATTCGVSDENGEGSLVAVANAAFRHYAEVLMDATYNQVTLVRTRATIQVADGAYGSVESDLSPVQGGAGVEAESLGDALLVRKTTSALGRKGRGRFFLPGILGRGDMAADGGLLPQARAVFEALVADFYDAMATGEGSTGFATPPVLLHNDATAPTPITAFQLAPLMGQQRGRIR